MFGTSRLYIKLCLWNIYWYRKKTGILGQAVQIIEFCVSIWEGSGGVVPPNYVNIFVA